MSPVFWNFMLMCLDGTLYSPMCWVLDECFQYEDSGLPLLGDFLYYVSGDLLSLFSFLLFSFSGSPSNFLKNFSPMLSLSWALCLFLSERFPQPCLCLGLTEKSEAQDLGTKFNQAPQNSVIPPKSS